MKKLFYDDTKIMQAVITLESEMRQLKECIWKLEHPFKFNIGQSVTRNILNGKSITNMCVVDRKTIKQEYTWRVFSNGHSLKTNDDYANQYLLHKNGDPAFWADESELS